MLDPGKRGELESAIMTKFNEALKQFNLQISVDTDVPDPESEYYGYKWFYTADGWVLNENWVDPRIEEE